jgi:release factor glutamine methyltransferase
LQKKSCDEYYHPSEDTFFLADHIRNETGKTALDIGTGSGFLAKILSHNFEFVVATDINHKALKKAHEGVKNCVCCDAADALAFNFDLVVCNLPYLPSEEIVDPAVDGLEEGVTVPMRIVRSASKVVKQKGKLIYLTSSHANFSKLMNKTEKLGFSTRVLAKKKLFFEELILVECVKF